MIEHNPTDQRRLGLYRKFNVERTDGRDAPGQKHHGSEYFVLDLSDDPFALPALVAYRDACRDKYPQLAEELDLKISAIAKRLSRSV